MDALLATLLGLAACALLGLGIAVGLSALGGSESREPDEAR